LAVKPKMYFAYPNILYMFFELETTDSECTEGETRVFYTPIMFTSILAVDDQLTDYKFGYSCIGNSSATIESLYNEYIAPLEASYSISSKQY
jgi:hypothetical protein